MLRYVFKRLGFAVLTLWVLITLTFILMHLLPGDPFVGSKAISDSTKSALYAKYGLDQPLLIQYLKYLGNALQGDFGDSMIYTGKSVSTILFEAFPFSFDLGIRALLFAVITGMLLGIVAALNRGKVWDTLSMVIAAIGISVPSFILGTLLQYFVALKLSGFTSEVLGFRLLPIGGWSSEAHKILPSFVLGLSALAVIARMMRSSLLDVANQDYIKTAKARGLSQRQLVVRHMLRNAVMPVMTVLGPLTASVLTGAFVVENIFNIPGMGKYFVSSVQTNDYTMIAGTTLFLGVFLIGANLLVDLSYPLVDPNIRLFKSKV
ncbi:ABC transporter permease [Paenibacillus sp. P46E]|uniref:ABC transporter permease n=1 Tax=Paenibacillus sp. P46E TaxID=1349436 RepID=UPI00093A9345|nr:ABC transporter permease [Paenibacillus sp. P46E]OKP95159.1 peptide ABC transporter permease [Paenibacillus sp. P46E]